MILVLAFLAMLAVVAGFWLSRQGLMAKPWLQEGAAVGYAAPRGLSSPPAKVGLGLFLVVASTLFLMLISAYFMRKELPDWRPLPLPPLLFFTTGLLVASSAFLGLAWRASERRHDDEARLALLAGAATAIVFVAGQMAAWRQMWLGGFDVSGNPSNTFFYLFTGIHGLHVIGGLVALAFAFDVMRRDRHGASPLPRPIIELCALYWDFLLVVWLVLLAVSSGYADGLGEICRQLLS